MTLMKEQLNLQSYYLDLPKRLTENLFRLLFCEFIIFDQEFANNQRAISIEAVKREDFYLHIIPRKILLAEVVA